MVVIYTQDGTLIHRDADSAKKRFLRLYGRKFGIEAYNAVMGGRAGTSYRKYGGPLIRVVTAEEAGKTAVLERRAGML